jgi:hypothetical protein
MAMGSFRSVSAWKRIRFGDWSPLPSRRDADAFWLGAAEIDWDRAGHLPAIARMPSCEPVNLSAICNAGVEALGDEPGMFRSAEWTCVACRS